MKRTKRELGGVVLSRRRERSVIEKRFGRASRRETRTGVLKRGRVLQEKIASLNRRKNLSE